MNNNPWKVLTVGPDCVHARKVDGKFCPEFEVESCFKLTDGQLKEVQAMLGYHSSGYGFNHNGGRDSIDDGVYSYKWSCYNSCEQETI